MGKTGLHTKLQHVVVSAVLDLGKNTPGAGEQVMDSSWGGTARLGGGQQVAVAGGGDGGSTYWEMGCR